MKSRWMVAASAVLALNFAFAEDQETAETTVDQKNTEEVVVELEPILVTAMLQQQELKDVPLSVSVVTEEEIARSTASTTAELLADIPGVQVFDGAMSGMMRVGLRGENDRTLVLVDGVRISEQKSMSGAPILISPEQISQIEVIKGPGSVMYGSEAIGGIVNIVTKKGANDGFGSWINGSFDSARNGSSYDAGASFSEGNISMRVSAAVSDFDDMESADGKVENTSWNSKAFDARIDYNSNDFDAGVNFSSFDAEYEVYTEDPNMFMDLPEWKRNKLGAYAEKRDLTESLIKLRADAYIQNTKKDFINDINWARMMGMPPMMGTWEEYKRTQNDQTTFGTKLQSDWIWGDHYTVAGVDFMYDHLKSDDLSITSATGSFATNPAFGITPGTLESEIDASRFSTALFIQDEWSFAEDWAFIAGARGTYSKTESKYDPGTGTPSAENESFNGTLSFALVNTQIQDTTLRAVISQGYREPTLGELYTASGMAGKYISGNPDLDEETSWSGELGARYMNADFVFDIAAFYTEAKDYIDDVEDPNAPTGYRWENMDEATTYGVELMTSYDFAKDSNVELAPYLNATLMRRKFNDNYETGYPLFTARTGLRGQVPVNASLYWWADAYVRCASSADNEGGEEDKGWGTANFKTGLNLMGSEDSFYESISFELGLLNILDKEYTEASNGIPSPGRGVYISAGLKF